MSTRAVIYARYSSENQREASIEDQVRVCRERIAQEGWTFTGVHQDRALSGAGSQRPGYQALLAAARSGSFDVVVAEALDRLSRDQEHIAGLFKELRFAGVRIVTLSEGEVSELHIGLKGTMNALFLSDLAAKTRRGLRGRIEEGKSAGGICYGYDVVRRVDERGEPIRGERLPNLEQAAVVRQIFQRFAQGASPLAIAKELNAAGRPGPRGRAWRDTTIRGHAQRGTGILRNELYAGRLIWNRMRFVKDPASGKRVSRANPHDQRIVEDVPHLRLVDDELWARVQERLAEVRDASGANRPDRNRFWEHRRVRHLLTGKCLCGACGASFTNFGRDYLACNAARKTGTCINRGTIRRSELESLVLNGLRAQLMSPEATATFVTEFTAEWNRLHAESAAGHEQARRELASVERKLNSLIDAIAEGMRAPGLQQKLDELETRKAALQRQVEAASPSAPRLHPSMAMVYRAKVEGLQQALSGPHGEQAREQVRGLIDRIVLSPPATGKALEVELVGEIASMLRLAVGARALPRLAADRDLFGRSVKVVAGVGFEPTTFRL